MAPKSNSWLEHLANYRSSHPSLCPKECMKRASASYRSLADNTIDLIAGDKNDWWTMNTKQETAFKKFLRQDSVNSIDGYTFTFIGNGQSDRRYAIRTSDGKNREIFSMPTSHPRKSNGLTYIGQ